MLRCKICNQELIISRAFVMEDGVISMNTVIHCDNECDLFEDDGQYVLNQINNVIFFDVSYPDPPTWNGKTSLNEEEIVVYIIAKDEEEKNNILNKQIFEKRWSDGWVLQFKAFTLDNHEDTLNLMIDSKKESVFNNYYSDLKDLLIKD